MVGSKTEEEVVTFFTVNEEKYPWAKFSLRQYRLSRCNGIDDIVREC